MTVRYASDKPKSCELCYFWHPTKKKCTRDSCYYILPKIKLTTMCNGCPYGRAFPCIGWCTMLILKRK